MSSEQARLNTSEQCTESITHLIAPSGLSRLNRLEATLQTVATTNAQTYLVMCRFDEAGPWAGPANLLAYFYEQIQSERPDLINKHSLELIYIMPRLRRSIPNQNPTLTDLASPEERVRSYPIDRAYRIVHGLIDLIEEWKSTKYPDTVWVIGCDGLDDAGVMTRQFFRELVRRRGQQLKIELIVTSSPHGADDIQTLFSQIGRDLHSEVLDVPIHESSPLAPAVAEEAARQLESEISDDRIETAVRLPSLIHLWTKAERFDMVLKYRIFGMDFYNTLGLYEDSLRYGEGLIEMCREYDPDNEFRRWAIASKMLNIYLGLVDVPTALAFAERMIEEFAQHDQFRRAVMYYTLAMLYGRYRKPRDLSKGEEYLNIGIAALDQAWNDGTIASRDYAFQSVFNRNGLAMIRNFQRRHDEAIEICKECIETLDIHLSGDEHLLHRSVLLFNVGQVYGAIGLYEEAIKYYTSAVAMDPNYSEYYNDRGSAYLHAGQLDDAEADYRKALELSPPYFEVLTNLGQCHRRKRNMTEAIDAYTRSLDIEPGQILAYLGRAKAHEELNDYIAAMADYSAALRLDGSLWEALASRAILSYEAGDFESSLVDLNQALTLKPEMGALYENRAVLLSKMGMIDSAREDIKKAIAYAAGEGDRVALWSQFEHLFPAEAGA